MFKQLLNIDVLLLHDPSFPRVCVIHYLILSDIEGKKSACNFKRLIINTSL